MRPLLGMLHRGGAALVLAALSSTLVAHLGPTPKLTPTPISIDLNWSPLSHADRSFMRKAAMEVRKEITVSQSVMDQLSNPQIKSFAQQVITNDTLASSDLMTLAGQKGVEISAKDESPLSDDWSKKTVDVDRQFVKEMVSDQEDAVTLFEEASKSGDTDVAAFAQKTLPSLQRQLTAAQDLQKAID